MSNAATDSNINPIGLPERSNVTVSSVSLNFSAHDKIRCSSSVSSALTQRTPLGAGLSPQFLVNDRMATNIQVNNLQGNTGTLLSLSGVVTVGPGKGTSV